MVVGTGHVSLRKEQKHFIAELLMLPSYPKRDTANMALDILKRMGYKGATVQVTKDIEELEWCVLVVECASLGHTAYECDQTNHPKG